VAGPAKVRSLLSWSMANATKIITKAASFQLDHETVGHEPQDSDPSRETMGLDHPCSTSEDRSRVSSQNNFARFPCRLITLYGPRERGSDALFFS
jgi:hypothetical protein